MASVENGHQKGRAQTVIKGEDLCKPPGAGVISQKTIFSVAAEAIVSLVGNALAGRDLLPRRTGNFKVVLRCLASILVSFAFDTWHWASRRKTCIM